MDADLPPGSNIRVIRVNPRWKVRFFFAMNSDLERLIALQEADREIERLNREIALLPRKVAAIEGQLALDLRHSARQERDFLVQALDLAVGLLQGNQFFQVWIHGESQGLA